jgi:hypothetical protein
MDVAGLEMNYVYLSLALKGCASGGTATSPNLTMGDGGAAGCAGMLLLIGLVAF